jgi:hypothetical protein
METVDTFGEPRAWALQWEGSALLSEPQEPQAWPRPQLAWNPRWQRVALVEGSMSASRNGHHAGAWREPSSWSLAWDVTVAVDGTATAAVAGAPARSEAASVGKAAVP